MKIIISGRIGNQLTTHPERALQGWIVLAIKELLSLGVVKSLQNLLKYLRWIVALKVS